MTDDELEGQLRAHYRTIDPVRATGDLGRRIEDAMDRRVSRPIFIVRARPAFAAAIAAVLIVAVGLGLRPGGFLSTVGASPSPNTTPTPSASSTSSASPAPSSGPASPAPSSSPPPVSTVAWTGLRLQAVDGGPIGISTVAAWVGGYLALGQPSDQTPLPAWKSVDGRKWTALPSGTFGVVSTARTAPIPGGVIVATQDVAGQKTTIHRSTDGVTWTSNPGPTLCRVNSCPSVRTLSLSLPDSLAGDEAGVVAIASPDAVAFSADGITWHLVSLPGPAAQVQGVATFGSGFVAVGAFGTTSRSPVAWWSNDGLDWTRATVEAHPGDDFTAVYAAKDGLMALSSTGNVPGLISFWTSPDGHSWKPSSTNPMGVVQQGEGVGSANGAFSGDGTRLLGFDPGATGAAMQYWTSLDGTDWTKVAVTGDTTVASIFDLAPFLLPDGVLFNQDNQTWFGAAVP